MQRIVPFVDHEIGYRLLQKLVAASGAGWFNIPSVVTTQENGTEWWPGVQDICSKAEIPLFVYGEQFGTDNPLLRADWFLLLSWKHVISTDVINLPSSGVVNLHYSLLPAFRGVYPVNWAITSGKTKTGFTYHFVTEEIDAGKILYQGEVPIYLSDTARTLQSRIDNEVLTNFDYFLDRLMSGDFSGPQLHVQKGELAGAEYYSRESYEKACRLDLGRSYLGKEFFDLLRGLTFFEDSKTAYIVDNESGKKIYVTINICLED